MQQSIFWRSLTLAAALALAQPVLAQARDEGLLQAATAEQGPLLDTLQRLVNIETGTGQAEGLAAIEDVLEAQLKALGATVTRHPASGKVVGDNLVARFTGRGGRRLLLMAHQDTVYVKGTLARNPWHVEGRKAYGPGIADDKGGMALILHTLRLLQARGFDDYGSITVSFNVDEEKGSAGSRELIQSLAREADHVLSFEPASALREDLIYGTSGIARIEARFKGRAAHAGVAPEQGVNALTEAADFILRTQDLDHKEQGLRFNWTIAQAGAVANIIPDEATLVADLRFARNEDIDATLARLRDLAARPRLPDSHIEIKVLGTRPAFNATPEGRQMIDQARAIYREVGVDLPVVERGGGGTDAAYAALSGKPVMEGLGLPGFGYHSNQAEYIDLDAVPRRLYLAARLIMTLGRPH
ncbi:MAG: M20/M25/M40 family metallo-hydrolase [Curvibacter sp.]|nr:M20/M25/M40 family metallo-hydrolase [Curvibacter sp.]